MGCSSSLHSVQRGHACPCCLCSRDAWLPPALLFANLLHVYGFKPWTAAVCPACLGCLHSTASAHHTTTADCPSRWHTQLCRHQLQAEWTGPNIFPWALTVIYPLHCVARLHLMQHSSDSSCTDRQAGDIQQHVLRHNAVVSAHVGLTRLKAALAIFAVFCSVLCF